MLREMGIDWREPSIGFAARMGTMRTEKTIQPNLGCHQEDWLLMDQDECWFSRFAQPRMHSWAAKGEEVRLVQRQPKPKEPDKALACLGRLAKTPVAVFSSDGQPDTERTILMLERLLEAARREKKRCWLSGIEPAGTRA